MTYVMSDLHGMYDRFIAMLEKIDFSDSDELFIIGDIIDRGERPVDILEYVMDKPNITVLLGNHEVMARDLLSRLTTEITEENINSVDDDFLIELSIYKRNGGATTMKQLRALPPIKRKEIIDFIDSLYAYEAIDIGDFPAPDVSGAGFLCKNGDGYCKKCGKGVKQQNKKCENSFCIIYG